MHPSAKHLGNLGWNNLKGMALRDEVIRVRLTAKERARAEKVCEKLGSSLSAAYRQAMNRLYDELFNEKDTKKSDKAP